MTVELQRKIEGRLTEVRSEIYKTMCEEVRLKAALEELDDGQGNTGIDESARAQFKKLGIEPPTLIGETISPDSYTGNLMINPPVLGRKDRRGMVKNLKKKR